MTRPEFETSFIAFQPELTSYLYRMACERALAEDLAQDTFIKALQSLASFQAQSSLKTWVFAIATNLARDHFRVQNRWRDDAQDKCKEATMTVPENAKRLFDAFAELPERRFEIREHISFCFNCMAKTLSLEEQIAIILADIYEFKRTEIAEILGKTEGVVKHLLFGGRQALQVKFEHRCALVNKQGVCYQCAELCDALNTPPASAEQLAALPFAAALAVPDASQETLLEVRTALIKGIDPLQSNGSKLEDTLMQILHKAIA